MMSRTHLAVGVGTALAITMPQNTRECCLAVMGGAIGGVLPDIDILDNDKVVLRGQMVAWGVALAAVLFDFITGGSIYRSFLFRNKETMMVGLVAFIMLFVFGVLQPHRGFTHSILGAFLYIYAIHMICPIVAPMFAAGFFSHILIDLLNKKGMRLFFPLKKGVCLRLCYANKMANECLMYLGAIVSVVLLLNGLFFHGIG